MVNWNDPTTLYLSARATVLTEHTVFGIYLWEMLNFLDYDWNLVVRQKRFTLASVLYLLTRYTALAAFTVQIRISNALTKINCEGWVFAAIGLPYVSIAFCTGLLSLRVFALSGKSKVVLAVLAILYAGFWASILYGIVKSQSVYIPELYSCGDLNLKDHRINTFVQFGIDLVFIVFMAIFLLRGHRGLSLWKFLVQQSAIYFIGVTFGYFLAAVFLLLPLNDVVAQSTGVIGLLIDVICATRMQRGLMEYNEVDNVSSGAGTGTLMFAAPNRDTAVTSAYSSHPEPRDIERGDSASTMGVEDVEKLVPIFADSSRRSQVDQARMDGVIVHAT